MNKAENEVRLEETDQYDAVAERRRLLDEERQRRELEYVLAEAPLVNDLTEIGLRVQSVWDLVNTTTIYPQAINVLLSHLNRPYPSAIREGIARALAVPEASGAWDELAASFRAEADLRVKDGLAVAVLNAAGRSRRDEVVSMLLDRSLGPSRVLICRILKYVEKDRAKSIMSTLAQDPDLAREIEAMRVAMKRSEARRAKRKVT